MESGVHGMESEEIACIDELIEGWGMIFSEFLTPFLGKLDSHRQFFRHWSPTLRIPHFSSFPNPTSS